MELDEDSKCRVVFREITKDEVKKAVDRPRAIDMQTPGGRSAGKARAGTGLWAIPPFLRRLRKVKKGFSAGRVQSVANKLICDREYLAIGGFLLCLMSTGL